MGGRVTAAREIAAGGGRVTAARRAGGLGRGLGALIPTSAPDMAASPQPVLGARFAELPLDQIVPNPLQPRQHFDEAAIG